MPRRAAVWSYIYYWVEWTFFGHNVSRAVMKRDVSSSARSSFAFIIIIIIIVVIEVVVAPLTAHAVPRTEGAPRVAAREPATAKSCVCRFMTGHNRCWPVAHHVTMAPPLEISLERHRRTASFLRGTSLYTRCSSPRPPWTGISIGAVYGEDAESSTEKKLAASECRRCGWPSDATEPPCLPPTAAGYSTTRGCANSRTGQVAVSRMPPAVVLVVLIEWLDYVDT